MRVLTPKQRAFVEEYLRSGNGTAAARYAGYNATYGSLRAIASENLKKPLIRAYIEHAKAAWFRDALEVIRRKWNF